MKKVIFTLFAMLALHAMVIAQTTVEVTTSITTNTTWTRNNVYKLRGFIFIRNGATLTIEPGTVIRGDKATRSTLIVTRGSKIIADGTRTEPIVFTSGEANPRPGDWGGIVMLGRAATNTRFGNADGVGAIEGDINSTTGPDAGLGLYGGGDLTGGPVNDDNSGVLRFVRIEYPGVVISDGNEINGLTMGGVGSGTTIEYVQVSYCNDDAFEWFGGNVNAKYLISYRSVDDDFDTDFGYSGNVQFAFAVRDPNLYDSAGNGVTHGFEADNDGQGSTRTPKTRPTFSNVTIVGPNELVTGNTFNRGAFLRRNVEQGIFNSIITGNWRLDGIRIDGQPTIDQATAGNLEVKNTIVAVGGTIPAVTANIATFDAAAWMNTAAFGNRITTPALLALAGANNLNKPNLLPTAASPALTGASFTPARIAGPFFQKVGFVGAFGLENGAINDWTCGWARFQDGVNLCLIDTKDFNDVANKVKLMPSIASNTTNLEIEFNQSLNLQVNIFDMQGRLMSSPVRAQVQSGTYNYELNVSNLPTGIYFVQIQAGGAVKTEKLIVTK
jgi:Secretion system C-terminal sorting domain